MPFVPAKEDELYYNTPAAHSESAIYTTFVDPLFKKADPTYGRGDMPVAPAERAIRENPAYSFREERVYLNSGKTEWVYYQVNRDRGDSDTR